jgi:hypothetical protein
MTPPQIDHQEEETLLRRAEDRTRLIVITTLATALVTAVGIGMPLAMTLRSAYTDIEKRVNAHDVQLMSQGKDLAYIRDKVSGMDSKLERVQTLLMTTRGNPGAPVRPYVPDTE